MTEYDFLNKIVLISGAGRGLGKRAAERFGKAGAKLVLNDYSSDTLEETLKELGDKDYEVCGIAGDIADEDVSKTLVAMAEKNFGGLNITINNAGIAQNMTRLHETDTVEAKRVVDVDLMGVFYAMKHQIPLMLKTAEADEVPSVILNLASAAGVMGSPNLAIYSAAKHGVVALTRSAALEYATKGIRVNALCPSFTRTNMVTDLLDGSKHGREIAEAKLLAFNPMGRLGEVDEIVQAMLWVCSDENSYYTGQTLSIDGGLRTS
ncbi:MAG: SDR family oxidoreductase [Rhizobiaceae bacterium]|nr:SDR family oxidoreductase [Rhizobiaceae bacterium]